MYKLKRASERREGIQTPILPEDAVRQTKEASPMKVSPAWSCGGRGLNSGRKKAETEAHCRQEKEGGNKK